MLKSLFILAALALPALAQAQYNPCAKYANNKIYAGAIAQIATHTRYTTEQLCSHPRILDIYVDRKNINNPQRNYEPEMHLWVTLHYAENYSCQYFIRESDRQITRSNCYNTF
ncbi:MAG TPA: hypothetical protein PL182_09890 [Pseudobdellovibrionaceae bacterium]|nr:hypothetical protein [Pseudobdellovibrionaceae bacterium]